MPDFHDIVNDALAKQLKAKIEEAREEKPAADQPPKKDGTRSHDATGALKGGGARVGMKLKAKHAGPKRPGKKKWHAELTVGPDYCYDRGKDANRFSLFDRANDRRIEKVTDYETGEVIHAEDHPLTKHQGHGSAKKKLPPVDMTRARLQAQAVRELRQGTDWLTAAEIGDLAGLGPANPVATVSRWKQQGRIFALRQGGKDYYPKYALGPDFHPLPVFKEILAVLAGYDPELLAGWFDGARAEKTGEIFHYRQEKSAPAVRENLGLYVVRLSGQQILKCR